jgi:hypothetical protein
MMALDIKTRRTPVSREFLRGFLPAFAAFLCLMLASVHAAAQQTLASSPATAAPDPGDPKARLLLQQMVAALGGSEWLAIQDSVTQGRTASFFHGNPNGQITPYWALHRAPDEDRIELTSKRDVIDIFTPKVGVEITFKGRQYLPQADMDSVLRRRAHSIEAVAHVWMKDPSATVFYMGTELVGRRQADIVRIVNAQNDNVTLDLDTETHLPLRRSFRWRNATYKDFDEESEEYDAYQTIQGFPTPLTVSRYQNGDLVNQHFILTVDYNVGLPADLFDPAAVPIPQN